MKHVLTALGILAGLTLFSLTPTIREMPWTPLRMAGLALMIPSFVLVFVARFQLGRSFSVRPKATALVSHGLYARIRNPIYFFSSIFILGLCLYINQPYLLLLLAVIVPLQFVRAKKEGRVLEEKFGEDYRNFKKTTWF